MRLNTIIFLLLLCGCAPKSIPPPTVDITPLYERFIALSEESLTQRSYYRELNAVINSPYAIPSATLHRLKRNLKRSIEIKDSLQIMATTVIPLLDHNSPSASVIQQTTLGLASALLLYDNYLQATAILENNEHLRRIINGADPGLEIEAQNLKEVSLQASSLRNLKHLKSAISFWRRHGKSPANPQHEYLNAFILNCTSLSYLENATKHEMTLNRLKMIGHAINDGLNEMGYNSFGGMSKSFGNTVGIVEERKGKLYQDSALATEIESILQPMDLLLEKTPFRLTDKLIPGYFGHVAIWSGTPEEHKAMSIDTIQTVARQQFFTKNGGRIIEALRSGVEFNSTIHFLNIDDLLILRPTYKSDSMKRANLVLAFEQIGKEYDFNFDVETTDKIVCSEIVYACLPQFNWPTERKLGRFTISPDHVAQYGLPPNNFEIVLFIVDGKLVPKEEHRAKLKACLTQR